MALGARPDQVGRFFLVQALRLIATGLLLGVGGAAASSRGLQALLYQVAPLPAAVLAATGILLVVSRHGPALLVLADVVDGHHAGMVEGGGGSLTRRDDDRMRAAPTRVL